MESFSCESLLPPLYVINSLFNFFPHSYHSSCYIVFSGLKFEKSCLLPNKLSLLFVPSLFCFLENIYGKLLQFLTLRLSLYGS